MEPTLTKVAPTDLPALLAKVQHTPSIVQWRDSAFTAAVDKFMKTKGNAETVMQTGEAFGRGLFTEYLEHTSKKWTMKQWLDLTLEQVLTPLGTPFECMTITQDAATSVLQKNTFLDISEKAVPPLFTYGFLRGLFLSAFPNGELLIENLEADDTPMTRLTFKTHASFTDKFERERVKHLFTSMK